MPGGHSPGDRILAPPDLVQIVPSIISAHGFHGFRAPMPATLRLWNPDPSDGFTFMLSLDSHDMSMTYRELAERVFGGLGSSGTVAVRFADMNASEGRTGISSST